MGKRDYRHHEPKKPKKDAKKPSLAAIQPMHTVESEVIRKERKKREEGE